MEYAPIALFTYNRPDKTQRVLESLMQNTEAKDSDLFIFSDGPKNENAVEGVHKNREYIHQVQESSRELRWFKSITLIERDKNWGLASSLIAGITEVINKYGKVIVVEDDLLLSCYFLKFMNDGLEKYMDEDKVGAISGYVFPHEKVFPETFFMTFFDCWGWATWKRSWDLLITDTNELLYKLRFKKNKFDVDGAYGNLYCTKVRLVDSWYVRFYASLFLNKKLILFPGKALVNNTGCDGSGTHCVSNAPSIMSDVDMRPICLQNIPIEENVTIWNFYKQRNLNDTNLFRSLYYRIKSFTRRLLLIDCW